MGLPDRRMPIRQHSQAAVQDRVGNLVHVHERKGETLHGHRPRGQNEDRGTVHNDRYKIAPVQGENSFELRSVPSRTPVSPSRNRTGGVPKSMPLTYSPDPGPSETRLIPTSTARVAPSGLIENIGAALVPPDNTSAIRRSVSIGSRTSRSK